MPRHFSLPFLLLVAMLLGIGLAGCSEEAEQSVLASPEPITDGDACHVCGMTITNFPGPKGQAFMKNDPEALKFCSTMDLFTFLKQPENETQLSHAYVHNIAETTWENPADDAYVRAVDAWYVVGHDRRGAMGHTLASFAEQEQAEAFRGEHGGEIIRFEDIDLELLGKLGRGELH
ncbi:copper chaperone NosL [Modicisalibacter ilicicola DSM 19980]|uniref:Copper chaperone NosL n=1 Tax=Modicisalibacter ilicicola DSM 19980 TaxID=1121942 RepID=A0A1M4SPW4_9GAMM|nr:nitrous oxide reductase accessory protein NosL [Halomonas ilicicola]SHE34215.1 copper chaperone NosL [Halomonas ilicicola DSM 19980]